MLFSNYAIFKLKLEVGHSYKKLPMVHVDEVELTRLTVIIIWKIWLLLVERGKKANVKLEFAAWLVYGKWTSCLS